jgi:inhibitor of KinA sporulation pathway (predicted exonuclease)
MEIIEFSAIILNLETNKFEGEFHTFVKPILKPQLTEFCKDLTGIK